MADILRGGRFGEPRKNNPEQTANEENQEPKKPISSVEVYRRALAAEIAGDERAKGVAVLGNPLLIERVKTMHDTITTFQGLNPSREVLADSERAWMSLSAEELAAAVMNSSEPEWKSDPGAYLALAREHLNRLRRIADQFQE